MLTEANLEVLTQLLRLARYQVLSKSRRSIAREDLNGNYMNPRTSTVSEGVRSAAALVGLALR